MRLGEMTKKQPLKTVYNRKKTVFNCELSEIPCPILTIDYLPLNHLIIPRTSCRQPILWPKLLLFSSWQISTGLNIDHKEWLKTTSITVHTDIDQIFFLVDRIFLVVDHRSLVDRLLKKFIDHRSLASIVIEITRSKMLRSKIAWAFLWFQTRLHKGLCSAS